MKNTVRDDLIVRYLNMMPISKSYLMQNYKINYQQASLIHQMVKDDLQKLAMYYIAHKTDILFFDRLED